MTCMRKLKVFTPTLYLVTYLITSMYSNKTIITCHASMHQSSSKLHVNNRMIKDPTQEEELDMMTNED